MLYQAAVFIHILSAVIWLGRRWRLGGYGCFSCVGPLGHPSGELF